MASLSINHGNIANIPNDSDQRNKTSRIAGANPARQPASNVSVEVSRASVQLAQNQASNAVNNNELNDEEASNLAESTRGLLSQVANVSLSPRAQKSVLAIATQ